MSAGDKVDSVAVGTCNRGRNNKYVVQGTNKEGSRFFRKLRVFLSCMLICDSEREDYTSDDQSKLGEGQNVTNDIVKYPPIAPRSTSSRSLKRPPSTKLRLELILNSSLLRRFSFNDLVLATRSFQSQNFLGMEGNGKVLKGWVNEHGNYAARPGTGIPVAVKILNLNKFQCDKEWLTEICYRGGLLHPNLTKLVGYCIEDGKRLLVYEYMYHGSLEKHLFNMGHMNLTWNARMKIAIGAANGLAFLHEEASMPMIFQDFKTSKILLDEDYNPKLSNFCLAKDAAVDNPSHKSTQIMGTTGYVAPEYMRTGHHTSKSDVYSFGIVLLEILTGRRAVDERMPLEEQNLVEWLRPRLRKKGNFRYLMDPKLGGQYPMRSAHRAMRVATHCIRHNPNSRPLMSEVVLELKSLPLHYDCMASQHSPSTTIPSTLLHTQYGLQIALAQNFPRHFQVSSLSQDYPLPPPAPGVI